MSRRDIFERKYSIQTCTKLEEVRAARMSNGSYSLLKIANAFRWWEMGYIECKLAMEIEQGMRG